MELIDDDGIRTILLLLVHPFQSRIFNGLIDFVRDHVA